MKKKVVAVVLVVLLAATSFGSLMALSGCGGNAYEKYIVRLNEGEQQSNGVNFKNYTFIVDPSFGWATAADDKRQALAEYAVGEAVSKAKVAGTFNYNIQAFEDGVEASTAVPLFAYDRDKEAIVLYVDGEKVYIPYTIE
jgi:hypothetical protein